MGDPVSWFLIRPGWKVVGSDGGEIGIVEEVTGDEDHDIFDGLAVSTSLVGAPRYVPAERVERIEEELVRLDLTATQAGELGEYLEPATNVEIEPGGGRVAGALRGLESRFVDPPERHAHPMNLWRRLVFLLGRPFRRS